MVIGESERPAPLTSAQVANCKCDRSVFQTRICICIYHAHFIYSFVLYCKWFRSFLHIYIYLYLYLILKRGMFVGCQIFVRRLLNILRYAHGRSVPSLIADGIAGLRLTVTEVWVRV